MVILLKVEYFYEIKMLEGVLHKVIQKEYNFWNKNQG